MFPVQRENSAFLMTASASSSDSGSIIDQGEIRMIGLLDLPVEVQFCIFACLSVKDLMVL